MNAIPPAVMGMKLKGKLGGVVSVLPTYPMSLTAKSVVWLVNSYRPVPEFEVLQATEMLYGAAATSWLHVLMAGEANDDPVPLIGCGVRVGALRGRALRSGRDGHGRHRQDRQDADGDGTAAPFWASCEPVGPHSTLDDPHPR